MRRLLLTTLTAFAVLVPAAQADRADDLLIEACRTGSVQGSYSQSDFRKAISRIPADSDQYTDCRDVLRRAQLRAARGDNGPDGGGSGGAGGSGGSSGPAIDPVTGQRVDPLASATPDERAAVDAVGKAGGAPLALAGQRIVPGQPGTLSGSSLPPTLLVLVALLALLALGGGGWATATRVRDRRAAAA